MSKIRNIFNLSNLDTVDDLSRYLNVSVNELTNIINGKIEFVENILSARINVNFTSANSQFSISHSLNKTPVGYIQIGSNVACNVYDGTNGVSDWSDSLIFLKCNAIAQVRLIII